MRRLLMLGRGVLLLLLGEMVLLGCGGGSGKGPTVSITLSPSEVSLPRGAVTQISAQALDVNNNAVTTPTLAYHSSNPAAITVSNNGLICAGQWNATADRCYACSNPDPTTLQCPTNNPILLPLGTASITATATVNDSVVTSSAVVVIDHELIDTVVVSQLNPAIPACAVNPGNPQCCVSQGGTAQYTAEALSNDAGTCQRINGSSTTPCIVPPSTIGTVNWQVSPAQVATLPTGAATTTATTPILVTADSPGAGAIVASVGPTGSDVSGSATFTTCPVASIHVQQQTACTPPQSQPTITSPVGGTVPLVACVLDSKGVSLTSTLALSWLTSQPALATVSSGTTQGATLQASAPGTASITAACLPPSCNVNLNQPIFSDDVVTANITGTTDSTVLVTTSTAPPSATQSNNIVSIDSVTNSQASAFALPSNVQVNSMVMTPVGDPAFLGTVCAPGSTTGTNGTPCSGLLRFDPTVSTVANPTPTITGEVLATNGTLVVLTDPPPPASPTQVFIAAASGPSIQATLSIANATAAAFSIDGSKIYIVAGSNLYIYSAGLPLQSRSLTGAVSVLPQNAAPQQVNFFATGAMAYVAVSGGEDVFAPFVPGSSPANCTDTLQTTVGSGFPTHVAALPNATGMVDANSPNIDEIDASDNGQCPPTIANKVTPNGFTNVSSFTARQLLVTLNSQLASILSDQGVLVYNLGTKQTSVVALSGGALPLSGGVTPDSASLYVGASDGAVHRVDLTKTPPVDAQAITVNLCPSVSGCKPDFVVIRPVATVATLRSLVVTPTNPTISVGATEQFTAMGTFSDGTTRDMTNFVTWTSSNTVVAIIGPNTTVTPPLAPGQAQALATGTSTITASSAGVSGSTLLTVQ